jgi:hypothetical protein
VQVVRLAGLVQLRPPAAGLQVVGLARLRVVQVAYLVRLRVVQAPCLARSEAAEV